MTASFTFVDHGSPLLLAVATAAPEGETPSADGLGWMALKLLAVLGLVLLNGFFVASEFAIVKVRSSQLDALAEEGGDRRVGPARRVVEHLDAYLSATQLGITLASLGLGWVGEPFVSTLLEPLFRLLGLGPAMMHTASFALAFAIITFLHIVLGELAPKSLAINKALRTTLLVSTPLRWFYVVFRPAIAFLNGTANLVLRRVFGLKPASEGELAHSEEELRVIVSESERHEEVTPLGKELLINALDLRRRVTREIMTPRGGVVFLDVDDSFEENLAKARDSRHTRFPLCKEHLDNPIGLVHIKDLLGLVREAQPDILAIRRDLPIVPEMMPLEKLLATFLAKHAHLALAVDEFGGAVGIVTLDNVLEELVGNIQDEFDVAPAEFRQVNPDEFVVEGILGLYELNDLAGLELTSAEVSTVGGYVTRELGHLPRVGEHVRIGDYLATVTQSDGRRVGQVHFKRLPPEERAATEAAEAAAENEQKPAPPSSVRAA